LYICTIFPLDFIQYIWYNLFITSTEKGVNDSMKKALTLILALAMIATFAVATGAEEDHECANCDTDYECIVAIADGGIQIVGDIEENDDETNEDEGEEENRSQFARAEADEDGGDKDLDTGIAGVMVLGAMAVLAAGAVAITRKRA
jgi:hypothetical protein